MSGHCAECRWWERHEVPDVGFGDPLPQGWHRCSLTYSGNDEAKHPTTLAFALDHESYQAELLTAPTFGCVQFQPIPASGGERTTNSE